MLKHLIGRLLRGVSAGEQRTAWHHPSVAATPDTVVLRSPAFVADAPMPQRFAGQGVGDNVSPPLAWSDAPPGTAEWLLIVEDPDAPLRRPIVHLIAFGLAPQRTSVPEGACGNPPGDGIRLGTGSFGRVGYQGPRPIPGHGPHRYIFQLFALRQPLEALDRPKLDDLLAAIKGQVVARGRLTGTYRRS